jgi:hypothetical protein
MSIRERPQELHLHLHCPSAQDVAAIVAQRGEEKPPWPPLSS